MINFCTKTSITQKVSKVNVFCKLFIIAQGVQYAIIMYVTIILNIDSPCLVHPVLMTPHFWSTQYHWHPTFRPPSITDTLFLVHLVSLIPHIWSTQCQWHPIFGPPNVKDTPCLVHPLSLTPHVWSTQGYSFTKKSYGCSEPGPKLESLKYMCWK